LVFFGNHLGFIWQKKKTRGKSMLKENNRAYLLKTLLSENQNHKNYLKVVFGKHALRIKKKLFVSFGENQTCQTRPYTWKGLSPTIWVGLLGLKLKPKNTAKKKTKSNEGFYWKSMNNTKNKMNLEIWIFTQTGFHEI
jgi:hypothetical protein